MLFTPSSSPSSPGIGPSNAVDAAALLELARTLREDTQATGKRTLRGKNIGMLFDEDDSDGEMSAFRLAATGLGAQVAQLQLRPTDFTDPSFLRRIVGTMARLYDAVLCRGTPHRALAGHCAELGLPLYGNLAQDGQHLALLAEQLHGEQPWAEDRRHVLRQAALLRLLA